MRTFARDPPWLLSQKSTVHDLDALPPLTPTFSCSPTSCHVRPPLAYQLRKGTISVQDALDTLVKFPSVVQFNKKWDDGEPVFATHARRYILALRPDSGVAFHETDRYKNPRNALAAAKGRRLPTKVAEATAAKKDNDNLIEVGMFATRAFKKGEVINLRGGVADLTDEQDDALRGHNGGRSEFSVLWSERKSCFCLLLGPARFCNHDCRNNVEFQLVGANMSFRVVEDIAKDEELFTHYGEHYFERDNATCLCATCEQHSKGAFTLKQPKKAKAAQPAAVSSPASTPSRRSGRAVAAVNYDESSNLPEASTSSGSGHAVTAQRSLRTGLSRSSSLSSLSTASSSTPPRRAAGSRANPSRIPAQEALRSVPRTVVQPKLPPPPGYKSDYVWDQRNRRARYVGPQISPVDENDRKPTAGARTGSMKRSTSAPSMVSLGKRRRGASDSPAPSTRIRRNAADEEGSPKPKRVRSSLVQLRTVRLGERSSSRLTSGTASARDRSFAQLNKALGKEGEESDLSEYEDSEEELEKAEQKEQQALESELTDFGSDDSDSGKEAAEVEAMLSPAPSQRSSRPTCQPSRPIPFSLPGLNASTSSSVAASTSVTLTSSATATRTTRSGTVIASSSLAVDVGNSTSTPAEEAPSPHLRCASTTASFEEVDADAEEDQIVLVPVPSTASSAPSSSSKRATRSAIGASGFYSPAHSAALADSGAGSSAPTSSSANGQSFRAAPSGEGGGKTSFAPGGTGAGIGGSGGGGLGGGGGGGDEGGRGGGRRDLPVDKMDVDGEEGEKVKVGEEVETKPAVRAVAAGKGGEAPAPEEQVADDPEDAAAALLMLLSAPLSTTSTRPPPPYSAAHTPPQPDSSAASTSTEASTSTATTATTVDAPSQDKKGKRKLVSDEHEPSPNPRSTRRQPKLDTPEPVLSVAKDKGKKKARLSETPAPPAASASTSRRRSIVVPPTRTASRVLPETPAATAEARRTRSKPLPGKLEDVLYAPETLQALGGYDHEKGRYISKHEALRTPSNDPRPRPRSPSPPPARNLSARAAPPAKPASTATARRSRLSNSPAPASSRTAAIASHAPSSRRGSLPGNPSSLKPSVAPPEGVRWTRRSFPIAQPLRDLIYSPAVLAANGGWDAEKGVYVSANSAASTGSPVAAPPARRTSSASAAPPSSHRRTHSASPVNPRATTSDSASAPPEGMRSTRRSFPMSMSMQDLVYGEAARSASGGWDEKAGKYVSAASAAKAAQAGGRI